jgi:predicted Holliday junction resolvase-like endonuclease
MMRIMVQALTALIIALVFLLAGYLLGKRKVSQVKKEALQRQRPILGGLFSEQIAPLLPDFPKDLKISEARFVGKPIDFLFFKGMDEKDITEVVFVEVKTGKSALTFVERKLRDAIRDKRVEWREYRISDEMLHSSEKMEPSSAESASAG